MGRQPKGAGDVRRIDADIFPPRDFVTAVMDFAVMTPAQGTVNSSLTLRPSARLCMKRRW